MDPILQQRHDEISVATRQHQTAIALHWSRIADAHHDRWDSVQREFRQRRVMSLKLIGFNVPPDYPYLHAQVWGRGSGGAFGETVIPTLTMWRAGGGGGSKTVVDRAP